MSIGVEFSCFSDVVLSPLWHFRSLVETVRLSVEVDMVHSFNNIVWMEILCVNMELDIRLLIEVESHEISHFESCLSAFIHYMRPEEERIVGLEEQDRFRISSLECCGRLEYHIHPSS